MPGCSKCGEEHELLDPAFSRPDPFVELDGALAEHSKADDDLCRITPIGTPGRYFVRGVLPVEVEGHPDGVWWGLWAEVEEADFRRIVELWSDEHQASEPPMQGTLANAIPTYPGTFGLRLSVHLTGPTSRPRFRFAPELDHPFARECTDGVDFHRAAEWNDLIRQA